MELTIEQAKQHPADFMYIWADENNFLRYINKKYASIIRVKKANQRKLLLLSAEKYGTTLDAYTSAIREAFVETYGQTPASALVILAQGGEIAGKNWSEGVFGIGALPTSFSNYEINGQAVTVDATTGAIMLGAQDITDASKDVYTKSGKKTIVYQRFSKDMSGVRFMSQYSKTQKKYAPRTWSDDHGSYSARTGKTVSASDGASIWGNVLESLQVFVNWILSLFGVSVPERETLNTENTLPNQKEDGFVQESGLLDATGLLLILAAGGALVATGGLKVGKKARK